MKELDGEAGASTGAGSVAGGSVAGGSVAGGSSVKGSDDGDAVLVDSSSVPGSAKKKKGGKK